MINVKVYNKTFIIAIITLIILILQNSITVLSADQTQSFYIGEHKVFFGRQIIPYKVEEVPGLNIIIDAPLPRDHWCHVCVKVVPSSNLTIKDIKKLKKYRKKW